MRRLSALLFALLLSGFLTPAVAANAPVYSATLTYDVRAEDGCILSWMWIDAVPGDIQMDITWSDHCSGVAVSVYARSDSYTLRADGQLRKGVLSGTVPIVNCGDGSVEASALCDELGQSITVDLALTSSGDVPGLPGRSQEANVIATGSIIAGGTNLVLDSPLEGYLAWAR